MEAQRANHLRGWGAKLRGSRSRPGCRTATTPRACGCMMRPRARRCESRGRVGGEDACGATAEDTEGLHPHRAADRDHHHRHPRRDRDPDVPRPARQGQGVGRQGRRAQHRAGHRAATPSTTATPTLPHCRRTLLVDGDGGALRRQLAAEPVDRGGDMAHGAADQGDYTYTQDRPSIAFTLVGLGSGGDSVVTRSVRRAARDGRARRAAAQRSAQDRPRRLPPAEVVRSSRASTSRSRRTTCSGCSAPTAPARRPPSRSRSG